MRSIKQPGPPAAERIQWVEARGRAFTFTLQAGVPLLEAARRGFAAEGFAGGVLNFGRGALEPFAYVMPALSKTGENAAFYSETYRPEGVTRTKLGSMTLGVRDGAPFFHCHGLWTEADGKAGGGHMLPDETVVAEPFEVEAFGIDGAMFTAEPDPETNFKLFGPAAAARTGARTTSGAFALRLRPNQDFAFCLEEFCRVHGIGARKFTAASARPSARVSPMAASPSRLPPSWRSRLGRSPPVRPARRKRCSTSR
jgi:predicted DNA-binding protein with PD1-like motif